MMARSTKKSFIGGIHGEPDRISALPDNALCNIISSLSVDEAARSSILSKRWRPLWRHASRLDFDERGMVMPLSKTQDSQSGKTIFHPNDKDMKQYGILVGSVLNNHLGDLTSCRFKHFPQSLNTGELKALVEFVLNKYKRLQSLSLECELLILNPSQVSYDASQNVKLDFHPRVFSNLCSLELTNYTMDGSTLPAFDGCEKLKILKLKRMLMEDEIINGVLESCLSLEKLSIVESTGFKKLKIQNPCLKVLELRWLIVKEVDVFVEGLEVMMIESVMCPPKNVKIYVLNLRVFHSSYNPIAQEMLNNDRGHPILKTHDIFENCSDLFESNAINIFQNLLTMSIDLDLNNMREAKALSFILRSCICLKTLEITIPAKDYSNSNGNPDECTLPFPQSMFWERKEMYNCIRHKLRFFKIRGFTSKEQEMKFVKYLIAKSTMMQHIIIMCSSSTLGEAIRLLSTPRAAACLSILLMLEQKDLSSDRDEVQNRMSYLEGVLHIHTNAGYWSRKMISAIWLRMPHQDGVQLELFSKMPQEIHNYGEWTPELGKHTSSLVYKDSI